jgi:phosphatidylglycerophosphate synthase
MTINASNTRNDKSLSYLLYLYLWPLWIFENANVGSFFERSAAYRRNRSKRVYLPAYTAKWMVIFTMLVAVLCAFESMGNAYAAWKLSFTVLACGAGILAILAFVVVVMTIAIYLLLTRWKY